MKIVLNNIITNFSNSYLKSLIKENYDKFFFTHVYSVPLIDKQSFKKKIMGVSNENFLFRIEYNSMLEFIEISSSLKIMKDLKVIFFVFKKIFYFFLD